MSRRGKTPTCVSSQDDRPYPFMEPWTYEGSWERAMDKLRTHLEFEGAKVCMPRNPRIATGLECRSMNVVGTGLFKRERERVWAGPGRDPVDSHRAGLVNSRPCGTLCKLVIDFRSASRILPMVLSSSLLPFCFQRNAAVDSYCVHLLALSQCEIISCAKYT